MVHVTSGYHCVPEMVLFRVDFTLFLVKGTYGCKVRSKDEILH